MKEEKSELDSMKNAEIRYVELVKQFTIAVETAIPLSQASAGLDVGHRLHWASILFCRLINIGTSILTLCPGSKINPYGISWDFGSIASLTRNLHECVLTFFYLCIEVIEDNEWDCRLRLMQLHDCLERKRMFNQFEPLSDSDIATYDFLANELRVELEKNSHFSSLEPKRKLELLKGEGDKLHSRAQILEKIGGPAATAKGMYRFLSSQTHSYPMAYYRVAEHERGKGEKNIVEMHHIATALEFADSNLTMAIEWMDCIFKGKIKTERKRYNLAVLNSITWKNVTGKKSESALTKPISYS